MKKGSSQLNTRPMQLRKKNLKKIRLVWIRTLTPGVPVQRCNQLSWSFNVIYEIHVFIISLKQRLSRLSVFFFSFRCRAVVPYPPQHEAELELLIGDVVYVTKKRLDGWYKGTLERNGKTGLFPGTFVESF